MSYRFQTFWRVRYDEVDLQGVVHHPRIVIYLEIARIEYWRQLGISYRQMREDGYEFIVKNVEVEYIKPLLFDEIITVSVGVKSLARASFVLGYEITKEDDELAVIAEVKLVCSRVGANKPSALPANYVEALRRYESLEIIQD
jgi:acyl-CoA thioester hydrolase